MKILKRCCIILLALLLAGTMALFGACAEEEPDPGTDPETPGEDPVEEPGTEPSLTALTGTVEDVFGTALAGVSVALDGEAAATTDAYGAFTVADVDLSAAEALTFTLEGYCTQEVDLADGAFTAENGEAAVGTVAMVKEYGAVSSLAQTDWAQAEDFTLYTTRASSALLVRAVSENTVFTAQGRASKLEIYIGVGTLGSTRDASVTKVTVESDGTVGKMNYGGRSTSSYEVASSVTEQDGGLTVELSIPYSLLGCGRSDSIGFAAGLYSDTDGARTELLTLGGESVVDVTDPSTYLRIDQYNAVTAPEETAEVDRDALTAGYSLRCSVPSLNNHADAADDIYLKADKDTDGFVISMVGFGSFAADEYVKLIFHTSETDGTGWNIQASDLNVLVNAQEAMYCTGLTKFWTTDGGYSNFGASGEQALANAPIYAAGEGYFTLTLKVLFSEVPGYSADGEVSLFAMEFCNDGSENGVIYDATDYRNGMLIDGVSHGDPAAQNSYFVIQTSADDVIDETLLEGFDMEFSMGADDIYAKAERGTTSVTFTFRAFSSFDDTDFIRIILHTADYDCTGYGLALSDVSFSVYKDAAYWQTGMTGFYENAANEFHGTDTSVHAPVYTEEDGYWTLTFTVEYIEFGTDILQDTPFRALFVEYTNGTENFGAKQDGVVLGSPADQANWFVL